MLKKLKCQGISANFEQLPKMLKFAFNITLFKDSALFLKAYLKKQNISTI
jgi:hypothetical protein